jgi:phosphoglycolate phosphatase-like HAD superfamily hydrolase
MKPSRRWQAFAAALVVTIGCGEPPTTTRSAPAAGVVSTADPLPSWNAGKSRDALVDFVKAVTTGGDADFVPPAQRIAVFDNDGTLWSEQPIYFQLLFAMDRVRAMAASRPEWKTQEPFKSVIAGDTKAALAGGEKALLQLVGASHAGLTIDEFNAEVSKWIETARHPTKNVPYTKMTFQPMLEALAYLRANGFKTFIVSGGGAEFMRAWAEQAYGIPPEQVVGSRGKLQYKFVDGRGTLLKLPEGDLVDDGPGKPVGIGQMIGRRPIAAFGNSDGDFEMLEYTTTGSGRRLGMIVHHTDSEREWAYDKGSPVGKLERGLAEADKRGWVLIDMKQDWKTIYAR